MVDGLLVLFLYKQLDSVYSLKGPDPDVATRFACLIGCGVDARL